MYQPYRHSPSRNRNFSRSGNGHSRGPRAIKSFDPTDLINQSQHQYQPAAQVISHSFADFPVSDQLKTNLTARGYKIPTPIQDQAIGPILQGQDLIGIANTGTGKTAAFLIPLIDKVLKDNRHKVLIITPTRELAVQIRDEFFAFSAGLGIYSALCIGGASMSRQKSDLNRGPNFVIGTPGRIQDLVGSQNLRLSDVGSVVLDEADHMVDIGFIHHIRDIIALLPQNRQSLFFSATIDGQVKEILQSFVHNPVTISVKTQETAENITQGTIKIADPAKKIDQLHHLLAQKDFNKVLVFARTKRGVQNLSNQLVERGFRADAIHGNKKQHQRIRALDRFKRNQTQVLIATDVASRGLDIPNVSHIINYDLPESYQAYIHRIGRTGRIDQKGIALTFISPLRILRPSVGGDEAGKKAGRFPERKPRPSMGGEDVI